MRAVAALLAIASVSAKVHFKEEFDASYTDRWVSSDWKKGETGKFEWTAGEWYGDAVADKGLKTSQDARFYAISTKFPKFSNEGTDLVIQFQVRFPQQIDCGGGYIKIFGSDADLSKFGGDSPYNIMFGPDVCGTSTKRVHVIFNYPAKKDNLLIKKTITAETDQLSHVYTLIVHPDNTYEVRVDGSKKESGRLEDDWDFLAAKEIKDPSVSKPSDWVDDPMMDDPTDKKPADYDSIPKQIPDPDARKPADWNDESDGEWEAPQIENPEYKGEWKPKRISNPAYKGAWVHPMIANPDYSPDANLYRYSDFGGVGIDVWQVKSGTIFDNIFIGDSVAEAEQFLASTYTKNKGAEKDAFDKISKDKREKEEADRKAADEARKAKEADNEEEEGDDDHPLHDDL